MGAVTFRNRLDDSNPLYARPGAGSLVQHGYIPLVVSPSSACTVTTADGQYATVNAAVQAASDGQTICVPAGAWVWGTTLTVSNKSITLKGAGIGLTTITNGTGSGALISWTLKPTGNSPAGFTRLTGFTFGGISSGNINQGNIAFFGDSPNLRVDHCAFLASGRPGLVCQDYVRGVVDHCTALNNGASAFATWHGKWQNTNGAPGYPNGQGDFSWASPLTLGTADALYFEDNVFSLGDTYRWVVDDTRGARVVYRNNTCNDVLFANHGLETGGRDRSILQAEIYNNTFNASTFDDARCHLRGGTGIVYDNQGLGTTIQKIFDMSYYRDKSDARRFDPFGGAGTYNVASITRSDATATLTTTADHKYGASNTGCIAFIAGAANAEYNGTKIVVGTTATTLTFTVSGTPANEGSGATVRCPYDQNINTNGILCLDQPGAGPGDYLTGNAPQNDPPTLSPTSWLNQLLSPIYIFNNLNHGVLSAGVTNMPDTVIENTHFYNERAKASFIASPITGMGRGLLSERPSSGMAAGVAWWSTDENKLYVATNSTTWVLYYTPLPYPHPLVS